MNSHVDFVHEIRTTFVIFDKLGKSSYEFARIGEGYVMNGMYCTLSIHSVIFVILSPPFRLWFIPEKI